MKLNTDGSISITIVTGGALTGLWATDGSVNVVVSSGGTPIGVYHDCGALNVTIVDGTTLVGAYADDGSLNIVLSGSGGVQSPSGAFRASVSGGLDPIFDRANSVLFQRDGQVIFERTV